MKEREESFPATDIAKFYIHDRHDKVLTGSFHHPILNVELAFTYTAEYNNVTELSDWLIWNSMRQIPIARVLLSTRENSITLVVSTHRHIRILIVRERCDLMLKVLVR